MGCIKSKEENTVVSEVSFFKFDKLIGDNGYGKVYSCVDTRM